MTEEVKGYSEVDSKHWMRRNRKHLTDGNRRD